MEREGGREIERPMGARERERESDLASERERERESEDSDTRFFRPGEKQKNTKKKNVFFFYFPALGQWTVRENNSQLLC